MKKTGCSILHGKSASVCTVLNSMHTLYAPAFATKNIKKILAFTVVELIISMITISCLTAAFIPVMTKKIKARQAGNSNYKISCSTLFNKGCHFCTPKKCIVCELPDCLAPKVVNVPDCTCKNCSISNCSECNFDGATCRVCSVGYELKDGGCSKINCADGKFWNGSTCATCPGNCTKCTNLTTCTACATGYEINSGSCVKSL